MSFLAGQVKVFSEDQMQIVHEKACQLLSEKGIVFEADSSVEIFKQHGVKTEGNTVFIAKSLVEKCLAQTPSSFRLEALDSARAITVGEGIAIHPAGGEVFVRDYNGQRRSPTLEDFANLQKLYQACDNVNIAGFQPLSPADVPDRTRGLYCTYTSLRNSLKPVLSPMELETIQKKEEVLKLYDIAWGSKGYLDNHYVTWHAVCPNSPYFYSEFACEGIEVYAKHGQPIIIVSAPMTGITSPVFQLSTIILTMAEELAGLVLAQLVRPGVPVVLSASLTYGYMRTASWECASPDTSLMLAGSIQMFRYFYHLPARAQTGVTSSKTIDYQAGMETMQSFLFSALAGVNLTSQTVSSLANLLTSSLEKTILDDELISRVRHLLGGLKFDDEQIDMQDLLEADPCADFLTAETTLDHFQEYWAPTISDWRGIDEWEEDGSPDVVEAAHRKVESILAEAPETLLDPSLDAELLGYIKSVEKGL